MNQLRIRFQSNASFGMEIYDSAGRLLDRSKLMSMSSGDILEVSCEASSFRGNSGEDESKPVSYQDMYSPS